MTSQIIIEVDFTALEVSEVYPEDSGSYTISAKNIGGEVRTSCLLTVEGLYSASDADLSMASDVEPTKPKFMKNLENKEVQEGARARLDCIIVAHPEPEVISDIELQKN